MGKRTHLKPTENDHAQDAINDAITHAEMIQAENDRAQAEDEALKKRGDAKDAREKANKNKALAQFEGVCKALQVRDQIVSDVINLIGNNRTVEVDYVARVMVHLGHDLDLVKIAVETANELEIMDNFVAVRKHK